MSYHIKIEQNVPLIKVGTFDELLKANNGRYTFNPYFTDFQQMRIGYSFDKQEDYQAFQKIWRVMNMEIKEAYRKTIWQKISAWFRHYISL